MFEVDIKLTRAESYGLYFSLPVSLNDYKTEFGALLFLALFRLRISLGKKLLGKSKKITISFKYEQLIALCHWIEVIDSTALDMELDSNIIYARAIVADIQMQLPGEIINMVDQQRERLLEIK